MSALDEVPNNPNFLSQFSYKFIVKKLPSVNFFCQKLSTPDVTLPTADQPSPFSRIHHHGDHITYGDLTIDFLVDEDLTNYNEMYKWLRGLGFPDNFEEHAALKREEVPMSGEGRYSDATLLLLTNRKNPNVGLTYRNSQPTYLSGLNFNFGEDKVQYITAQARITFDLFDIESIKNS